jgi:hypothetical protein
VRPTAADSMHRVHLRGSTMVVVRLLVLLVAPLSIVSFLSIVGAASDQSVVLESSDPILLGPAGVDVAVDNDGPSAIRIKVRGGTLFDSFHSPSPAHLLVSGREASSLMKVSSAESMRFRLTVGRWNGSELLTGTLEVLVVSGGKASVAIRRIVKVDPGVDIPISLDSWSVASYQGVPFFDGKNYHAEVPLSLDDKMCFTTVSSKALLSSGSDSVEGTLACKKGDLHATLSFGVFPTVGSYEGNFVTQSGTLDVTVRRSTLWVLPALLAAIGIALAAWRSWWSGSGRRAVLYEERVDAVLSLAARSQRSFAEQAAGTPWAKYNLIPAVLAWSQSSMQRLRAPDADSTVFDAVVASAAEMAGLVAKWQAVPSAIETLPSSPDDIPGDVSDHLPKLAASILSAAGGARSLASMDDVEQLEVDAFDYEESVPSAGSRLAQFDALAADPPTYPKASDRAVLEKAVQQIRALLSKAPDIGHVTQLKADIVPELDAIGADLSKLPKHDTIVRAMAAAKVLQAAEKPGDDFSRAMREAFGRKVGRRIADVIVFAIAASIGVFTALNELYVGKPWGTWLDGAIILVWAFGSTAILTDVLQALLNLVQRSPATVSTS